MNNNTFHNKKPQEKILLGCILNLISQTLSIMFKLFMAVLVCVIQQIHILKQTTLFFSLNLDVLVL